MKRHKTIIIISLQGFGDIGANGSILRNLIGTNDDSTFDFVVFKQGIKGFKKAQVKNSVKEYSFLVDGNRIVRKLKLNDFYLFLQIPFVFFRMLFLTMRLKPAGIVGIYPSEKLLAIGLIVAKCLKIKFFTWFHDLYSGTAVGFRKKISSYLEPFILQNSNLNFAISKAVERWYLVKYPHIKNWDVVPHPIDLGIPAVVKHAHNSKAVTIFFSGTIYGNCYDNLCLLLNVCKNFEFVKVNIITPSVSTINKIIQETSSYSFVKVDTKYSNDDVYNDMMSADILYLPISFQGYFPKDELNTMLPTKGIEYLLSNRLIFAHVPEESYVNEFMEKFSGVVVCNSNDCSEIEKSLIDCFKIIKNNNAFERNMEYYRPENVRNYLLSKMNV